jgi:hypothetical protein
MHFGDEGWPWFEVPRNVLKTQQLYLIDPTPGTVVLPGIFLGYEAEPGNVIPGIRN